MRLFFNVILALLTLLYPFAVWWAIQQDKLAWVSGLLLLLAVCRFLSKPSTLLAPLTAVAVLCAGANLWFKDGIWLKFYPVLMSLGMLCIFTFTLYHPPSMIERFARLQNPNLPPSGVRWTRQVTKVWCCFFVINAVLAFLTIIVNNHQLWALYNGLISYLLMGGLLLGEFILRKYKQRTGV